MTAEDFDKVRETLPNGPGVYKFIDRSQKILYVGKAKNLRKRVASYFVGKRGQAHKTRVMVKHSNSVECVLVDTESDALLLENTLIKKYQPRYNVQLKDAKSYTYICVKNERFPRVFFTRRLLKDGSTYFGPYTSKHKAKVVLDLISSLFPIRSCTFNLSEENIRKGKFKICLEYHIKNCEGPCEGLETQEAYEKKIIQIKNMLKGQFSMVRNYWKDQMDQHVENLEFEKAQTIKEKLEAFENYQGKSTVVSTRIRNVDVFSIKTVENMAFVNFIRVMNGAIIYTNTIELKQNLDSDKRDLLYYAVKDLREKYHSNAPEIITPFPLKMGDDQISVTVPKIGDKRKLLDLSEKNLNFFLLQYKRDQVLKQKKVTASSRILTTLQNDLQMDVLPYHIECFDNSNIQGTNPVASCVVFLNGRPSKKDYRHYHVKSIRGANDFASMEEIVFRRYRRQLDESEELPQLIVIDGGKGQLNAAIHSLKKLGIQDDTTVIGIAKKLEEIYFPDDPIPLYINKKSESLKLIQQIRNEAHRFAINFHRDVRSREFISSQLTGITGLGAKTAEKLLRQFGSVNKIKKAPEDQIISLIGAKKTELLRSFFDEEE